ncbi:MAG: PAS domain-containing protein, partial [Campylobacterales bacterium]|nr:PAS domain-containing protein [Campylobacterales bacterium]
MNNQQDIIKKLQGQLNEIQSILNLILLPILITSKKTRKIVYANPYAQKQYETTLEHLIGSEISQFYTNDEQREKILTNLKEDGTVENLEMHWKTAKGNTFYGLLSLTSINYNSEECYMGMVKDITLQKEQDARLARQSKMEALGEMISVVAHHWRQPLNAITVSSSGLLLQQELGILELENIKIELETINKEAQFLSGIIDDFRDIINDTDTNQQTHFSLNTTILTAHSINNYDFEIVKNLSEDLKLFGVANKFVKAIGYILQNCEDIFKIRLLDEKYVLISTSVHDNTIEISIQDSA